MDSIKKMPGNLFNETAGSRITDPFAVVTENSNISPANAAQAAQASHNQPLKANGMQASKGGDKRTLPSSHFGPDAAATVGSEAKRVTPHR
jgi:hypothetical protein